MLRLLITVAVGRGWWRNEERGRGGEGKLVWQLERAGSEQSVPGWPAPWEPRCSHLQSGYNTPFGGLPGGKTRKLLPASVVCQVFSKAPNHSSVCVCPRHMCVGMHGSMHVPMREDPRWMSDAFLNLSPPCILRCVPLRSPGVMNSATLAS